MHIGNVQNKGTYALLKSEISEIKRICENSVEVTVCTDDVETLRHLEPDLKVYPGLVDIPYERVDMAFRRRGWIRDSLRYKLSIMFRILLMIPQALFAITSALLAKRGLWGLYRTGIMSQIQRCDLVISTADANFKEASVYMPTSGYWIVTWWTALFSRMVDTFIAKKVFGKPVVVFPNSIGPFQTSLGLLMAKMIFRNVDLVMLRDPYSYELFRKLDLETKCTLTTDIALLLRCDKPRTGRSLPLHAVGVCPGLHALSFSSEEVRKYIAMHSMALDYLVERHGYEVVFLPAEISPVKHGDDLELSRAIMQNMRYATRARIVETNSVEEFKCYFWQLDLLITSRMHPAVLACADHVPTLMIVYDHKQSGFFAQLGLSDYTLPVRGITHEELLNKVKLILRNSGKVRGQLQLRVPMLQEDVRVKMREAVLNLAHGGVQL